MPSPATARGSAEKVEEGGDVEKAEEDGDVEEGEEAEEMRQRLRRARAARGKTAWEGERGERE